MNNINTYISINTLFSASRMGIGATTVIYLMQKGISVKEIALIKIIQAIVVFLGEVPTGMIADKFGRKMSIILSSISAIISFLLYYYGNTVTDFGLAEIFNALTLCLWSGAFDALVIQNLKKKNEEMILGELFSKMAVFESLGVMLAGYLGSLVGSLNLTYPFLFSVILMIICLIVILFVPETKNSVQSSKKISIKESLREIKEERALYGFFVLFVLIQFAYQPILHYWQPYFESLDKVNTEFLGRVFLFYVAGFSVFNFISNKLLKSKKMTSEGIVKCGAVLMIVLSIALMTTKLLILGLLLFVIMQGVGNALRTQLGSLLNHKIEDHNRATVLSAVSFISRFGMFTSLGLIAGFGKLIPVQYFFIITVLGFTIFFMTFQKINLSKI